MSEMKIVGEIIGRLIYVLFHKGLLTDNEYTYILSPLIKSEKKGGAK